MRPLTLSTILFGSVVLTVGCGVAAGGPGSSATDPAAPDAPIGVARQPLEVLVPLQGCGEVESYVRSRVVAETNRYFDQIAEQIAKNTGGGCYYGYGPAMDAGAMGGGATNAPPSPAPSSGSTTGTAEKASQSSGTNNQVAGVDEADFVKNDGKYLYVVANGALRILEAWPANEAQVVSKTLLDGEPRKLFVEGDRAVVYVAVKPPPVSGTASSPPSYYGGSRECTYGFDCVPSGDGTSTKVVVFDITNRAAPVKLRELTLSGSLLAARRIGDAVHTVVVDPPAAIDGLEWYPKQMTCDGALSPAAQTQAAIAQYEALRAQNLATIASTNLRSLLPSIKEGGVSAVAECSGYFRPNLAEGRSFTSLVSVDIAGGAPTTATVVSDPGVVYASASSLYMSVPHAHTAGEPWYDTMGAAEEASTVHQFRVGATPSLTGYVASGAVKGRVLNQFSLDEYDGRIRVATTTGHTPDPKVHSTMTILERSAGALVKTGAVDNVAPTEDIRSVRFDGSRGFVVTFKKTDPLYVFDLGNAYAPKIAGELKIPGFSTYMHMMDAQHLLTIGYDAADQGSFAWFTGIRLQIFDVSDMKNPVLAHVKIIGTRGSSSEALTNHLAFNYFAPKNLLALPMTICEGGDVNGGYGTNMTFSGLMVFDVTTTGGFSLRGQVSHPHTATGGYDSAACSNWWTQASSEVKRSVFMDDIVYSISDRRVKVNALASLSSDIANLSLDN